MKAGEVMDQNKEQNCIDRSSIIDGLLAKSQNDNEEKRICFGFIQGRRERSNTNYSCRRH